MLTMTLTPEQTTILNETGNMKINAVAGSGKTSTILEYARTKPKHARILYLAFNKSVKLEARAKFQQAGMQHVTVETAHSLAYRHVVMHSSYRVNAQGYKVHELATILRLPSNGEKHSELVLANHIKKFFAYYCNSDKQTFEELNYLDIVTDNRAKKVVQANYRFILKKVKELFSKMEENSIEITHDFYLKKFQLSDPKLSFQYLLFDEGQDASGAMLDLFFKQPATKIIVGDTHQQIYSWRFAVNSLEKAAYPTRHLSASFRFGPEIADLARCVLNWKEFLDVTDPFKITGLGKHTSLQSRAMVARTNLGLLLKAIEYLAANPAVQKIYFEGNFHSYTYAEDGASLYDVLNLYNNKRYLIRDRLIKEMQSVKELEDYISKTEDPELAMMVEIVKKYGNEIPKIIQNLKDKHLKHDNKQEAEMIFSTVHRCKGMEYDSVELANDFITEEKVKKTVLELKKENLSFTKLNEEINLLYVAITRTRNQLIIPETLLPTQFTPEAGSDKIRLTREAQPEEIRQEVKEPVPFEEKHPPKAYSVEAFRSRHRDAYKAWTPACDSELTGLFLEGASVKQLSEHFGRTNGAIRSRIARLNLER
jgi:superfamily I DNA/RNA helicase